MVTRSERASPSTSAKMPNPRTTQPISCNQGSMQLFWNYFRRKMWLKMALLAQDKAKLCKNWMITLVLEKNCNFFAENCRKLQ
jgi:hypothetical protein